MKEDSDEDDKTTLILYVSKGDKWIIDSDYQHQIIGDKSKFETLEQYKVSCVKFCNVAPSCDGLIKLTYKIKCDSFYWIEGLNYNFLSIAQLNILGY